MNRWHHNRSHLWQCNISRRIRCLWNWISVSPPFWFLHSTLISSKVRSITNHMLGYQIETHVIKIKQTFTNCISFFIYCSTIFVIMTLLFEEFLDEFWSEKSEGIYFGQKNWFACVHRHVVVTKLNWTELKLQRKTLISDKISPAFKT